MVQLDTLFFLCTLDVLYLQLSTPCGCVSDVSTVLRELICRKKQLNSQATFTSTTYMIVTVYIFM